MRLTLALIAAVATGAVFSSQQVRYSKDVAPIISKHCTPCHSEDGPAPFPLVKHEDTKKRAQQILRIMMQRLMPPCRATTEFSDFCSVPPVTDSQIITFQRWTEGEMLLDAEIEPPEKSEWKLGKPDAVIRIGRDTLGPLDGRPFWRSVIVPLPPDAQGYVRAFDIRPVSPRAVRQVVLFASDETPGVTPTNGGIESECSSVIGTWAPGYEPTQFPAGIGKRIDKSLRAQFLLVPTGKRETAECEVALYFSKQLSEPEWLTIGSTRIDIPPDLLRYDMEATHKLPVTSRVLSIIPEARLLCYRFSVVATLPNGETKTLFDNQQYDAYWQGSYRFRKPPILPKDTVIRVSAQYDNSSHGGKNQEPKRTRYGKSSDDEYFWTHLEYVPVRE